MSKVTVEGPVGADPTQIDTVPQFRVGTKLTQQEVDSSSNNELRTYRYVKTYDAIAAGQAVRISEQYMQEQPCTVAGVSEAPVPVGIAQTAVSSPSSASYTWLQTAGYFDTVRVLSACAPNVELYVSTTDGYLDDAAGKAIEGIRQLGSQVTANGTTTAFSPVELWVRTDA